ncbi:Protoheme IX farnesyltransferase, mitochondrial [Apophysomyces ossiformis]|uniref:Protoheme IX farnesyltransferase, mitochondrial n=1 Tax=Apophysomyces ossiformis TaxID=679940 RepID=A0A8H7C0X3_9FUNG|nr:Protoheme IX farnesyltransferase, mitochondrial [Apophysomyces ossiformis]
MLRTFRLHRLVRELNGPANQQHRISYSLLQRPSPTVFSTTTTTTPHVKPIALYTTATDPQSTPDDNPSNRVTKFKPITTPTCSELPKLYKELIKAKLAGLVALTTMSGYAMAPGAATVSTLLFTTIGTALCISSANAINQWIEVPYDAQMLRTRNRVLGRRQLSQFHAFSFGVLTGTTGVATLATMVNPLTAALGAANILLYTAVYTPMKRASIANTWAGAVVGAIPPMMGWAAVTNALDPGAWVLGAILYAWQFPHFNALAWNLRADYSKAGYRMMAVTDPKLNARVSLRYSLAMVPLCLSMPYLGLTSWLFAVDSTIVNAGLIWGAVRFWQHSNEKSGRQLFFGSVIHLPVLLALMMVHKVYETHPQESLAFEYVDEADKNDDEP